MKKGVNNKVIVILLSILLVANVLLIVNSVKMNNELKEQQKIIEELTGAEITDQDVEKADKNEDKTEETTQKKSRGLKVAIDAGHQRKQNGDQEPIGPGASETKMKVTSGTEGCETKVPEHQVNLELAKKTEKILKDRGYEVFMVRDTADVDISNKERADMAYNSGADIFIRIHCNSSESPSANGALTMCQTKSNQFVSMYDQSRKLSDDILIELCAETGANNNGVMEVDNMSGINWSKIPVTIIETGFMSNPDEDRKLSDPGYQDKIATGISDGIDKYFAK